VIWISAALVFGLAIVGSFGLGQFRKSVRRRAVRPGEGEQVLLTASGLSARVFVDRDLLAGPRAGTINRSRIDLLLSQDRLLVASHHGRLLELTERTGGSVRSTGPNRLVIEGQRPGQGARVRIEILCDRAEEWARAAEGAIHTSRSAA